MWTKLGAPKGDLLSRPSQIRYVYLTGAIIYLNSLLPTLYSPPFPAIASLFKSTLKSTLKNHFMSFVSLNALPTHEEHQQRLLLPIAKSRNGQRLQFARFRSVRRRSGRTFGNLALPVHLSAAANSFDRKSI